MWCRHGAFTVRVRLHNSPEAATVRFPTPTLSWPNKATAHLQSWCVRWREGVFGGVDFCFYLFWNLRGGPSAPPALLHLCDLSLGVCVFSFSLYTLSKMFSSSFLLASLPLLLVLLAEQSPRYWRYCPWFTLFFSLPPAIYISWFSSPFLFPFIYLLQVLSLCDQYGFYLKPRGQSERSYGIFEVGMLNMLNSKDVLKIRAHRRDVKRLNLFFPVPSCVLYVIAFYQLPLVSLQLFI